MIFTNLLCLFSSGNMNMSAPTFQDIVNSMEFAINKMDEMLTHNNGLMSSRVIFNFLIIVYPSSCSRTCEIGRSSLAKSMIRAILLFIFVIIYCLGPNLPKTSKTFWEYSACSLRSCRLNYRRVPGPTSNTAGNTGRWWVWKYSPNI
jgi:hypothetical protein